MIEPAEYDPLAHARQQVTEWGVRPGNRLLLTDKRNVWVEKQLCETVAALTEVCERQQVQIDRLTRLLDDRRRP